MADKYPKPVRWVHAFLGVITKAIYEPKRVEQQYRGPTPSRRTTYTAGWRNIVGGANWTKPENRKAHEKWTKRMKDERARQAAALAYLHEIGCANGPHHRSARTLRREVERRHA